MTMTLRMKTVQIYEADDNDDDVGDDSSLHHCIWWINKWPKTKLSANTFVFQDFPGPRDGDHGTAFAQEPGNCFHESWAFSQLKFS